MTRNDSPAVRTGTRRPASITTVLFDLDDTLVPQDESDRAAVLSAAQAVLDAIGAAREGALGGAVQRIGLTSLSETVHRHAERLWNEHELGAFCRSVGIGYTEGMHARFASAADPYPRLRAWAETYRRKVWLEALAKFGVDDPSLAEMAAERFIEERRKRREPFPEARAVLQRMRGRFRLGMLTNGASDLQREKIEAAGIGPLFDAIVISGDHGIGKPDPRIFSIALSQLDASPHEAAMVGNSLSSDVEGARAAGLYAVWVNRGDEAGGATSARGPSSSSTPNSGPLTPFDLEVPSLDALPWVGDSEHSSR